MESGERTIIELETYSDKLWVINAVCINCNKRFKSMHAVSMHLKVTAARHAITFINYGNYDRKTGLREMNRGVLNQSSKHTEPAAAYPGISGPKTDIESCQYY